MIRLWPVVPCRSLALAWGQTSLPWTGLCSLSEVRRVSPPACWLPECFSQPARHSSQAFMVSWAELRYPWS